MGLSRRLWMTLVRFDPVYVVYFKVRFDHLHDR
jgi:glutathionyl-hydroquinone reductase